MNGPLWTPSRERIRDSQLTAFQAVAGRHIGSNLPSFDALHEWSVRDAPEFWALLWDWAGIIGDRGRRLIEHDGEMPGARFLPDARLNFSENLLQGDADAIAILAMDEAGDVRTLTFGHLRRDVARAAAALRADGVNAGDRVAAVVSNGPEAVIAALAVMAIGAVWSSCSPDFGADGIVDRFAQIEPRVLLASGDGQYGGKRFDYRQKIADVGRRLPSLSRVVTIPDDWERWLGAGAAPPLTFARFPFDHPIYILYSSGTMGVPKCIVHGAGGTLLQHVKEHRLHYDVRPADRMFYFTTCGWMMWNWLVSALASRAAIVLFDGSPVHPGPDRLFRLVDEAAVTFFGTSARHLDLIRKSGVTPMHSHSLASMRTLGSTGSPLAAETFDFVYESIKREVHLASLSGGTDIVSCFVGGNPNAPVWRGEIQAAGLGMDVQVFDDDGRRVMARAGELVCVTPFPSMPVGFWNDPTGALYRQTYFERFPGTWSHGDWVTETERGGYVIHGRSDTTLKPGGVRIGTAEIYRQVEHFREVADSLVVAQPWQGDERVVLFVRMAVGQTLDDALKARIAARLREHASPRHVPARIIAVPDIPRTRSGKLVELAVRRVLQGLPVTNVEALANPESLEAFRHHPELAG